MKNVIPIEITQQVDFIPTVKKVLIFDGSLNPPTFIEVLIRQLAKEEIQVYLTGQGQISEKLKILSVYPSITLTRLGNNQKWLSVIISSLVLSLRLLSADSKKLVECIKLLWNTKVAVGVRIRNFNFRTAVALIDPDIIHIQWASHISSFRWLLDSETKSRPKFIVSLRGRLINVSPYVEPETSRLYQTYFPKVDAFHAVSSAIAQEAQRWGAPEERIRVIYSGLDLPKLVSYHKQQWQIQERTKVLMVGRFHWKKGYRYALDSLSILLKEGYDLKYLLIAGQPPEEIKYQLKDLGVYDRVLTLPNLQQEEVFRHMQLSDMLLLPSVEEGIANVVLEAMAIGLPVISSDCGGMREVIEDGVNGFLFENRNPAHMAARIGEMIRLGPQERERMARAARQTIERQHGLERMGREMVELYESVMERL